MGHKLRKFGDDPKDSYYGYQLDDLIGHIEALISREEEIPMGHKGPRAKRLEMVYDAVQLLNDASEM